MIEEMLIWKVSGSIEKVLFLQSCSQGSFTFPRHALRHTSSTCTVYCSKSTPGQDKFWICDSAILEEGGLELRFKIDFLLIGRHSPILALEF